MSGSKRMNAARLKVFSNFVSDLTTLSKCTDKKVACIITDAEGSQVYSIGINGGARGGPDCLCALDGTKYTCVHAEANALAKCTIRDPEKVIISSYSPCVTCAALMINSGVSAVYYQKLYKSDAGLKMLQEAGVRVHCIEKLESPGVPQEAFQMREDLLEGKSVTISTDGFTMHDIKECIEWLEGQARMHEMFQHVTSVSMVSGNIYTLHWDGDGTVKI